MSSKNKGKRVVCSCVTEIDSDYEWYNFQTYGGLEVDFYKVDVGDDKHPLEKGSSYYAYAGCGGCSASGFLPPPDAKDEEIRKLKSQLEAAREEIADLKKRVKKK